MSTASRCFLEQHTPETDLASHRLSLVYLQRRGKYFSWSEHNTILRNAKICALEKKQLQHKHRSGCQLALLAETTKANPFQCNPYLRKGKKKKRHNEQQTMCSIPAAYFPASQGAAPQSWFRFKYKLIITLQAWKINSFPYSFSCLSKDHRSDCPFHSEITCDGQFQLSSKRIWVDRWFWKGRRCS